MKILFFSIFFPNCEQPVLAPWNLQQARALSKYCEVRVVAPLQWFPVELWHGAGPAGAPHREEIEGLTVWHPRYFLTPGILRPTYSAQMGSVMIPYLSRIRREYPFDVILATWACPDVVVGAVASRIWKVPLLAEVLGNDINVLPKNPLIRPQIKWAMDRAHRVLAVSDSLRQGLLDLGIPDEKILVKHNGIDTERFYPRDRYECRRELGLEPGGKHIVFVGYLIERKAVNYLLDAVALMRKRGEGGFTVHLVGAGPLEEALRSQTTELGLQEFVRFHGEKTHAEIPTWMGAADVFCLPSLREGCPNVVLEAMGCGRPAVSTEVDGIPEITAPENSIIVPAADSTALAGALQEALHREWDPDAILRSVSRFSWDHSARALYDAACEARAAFPHQGTRREAIAERG